MSKSGNETQRENKGKSMMHAVVDEKAHILGLVTKSIILKPVEYTTCIVELCLHG